MQVNEHMGQKIVSRYVNVQKREPCFHEVVVLKKKAVLQLIPECWQKKRLKIKKTAQDYWSLKIIFYEILWNFSGRKLSIPKEFLKIKLIDNLLYYVHYPFLRT